MRKQPFLKFYASDWRSGTLGLSFELKGFYIDLLALMWDRQSRLPNDPVRIAAWLQCDPRKVRRLLAGLVAAGKMIECGGDITNQRLDREIRADLNGDFGRTSRQSPGEDRAEVGNSETISAPTSPRSLERDWAEVEKKSAQNFPENTAKSTDHDPPLARAHSRSQKPDSIKTPPTPPSGGPTPREALEAFEQYNATALRCGLPQASKLTPERQRRIRARLKDFGPDGWKRALANIEKSAFLTGGTDKGFRADLDFMLQAKSFGKLHDGGYGNGRHTESAQPRAAGHPPREFDPYSPEAQEIAMRYAQ